MPIFSLFFFLKTLKSIFLITRAEIASEMSRISFFFLYLKFIVHKNDKCCDVRIYWCFLANYPFLNRFHHAILENWKSNKAFIDNYKWKRFLKLKIAYRHVPYFRIKSDLVQCTHVYSMYLQVNKNVPTYNVIFF